ncbi:MAG: exodeoxyribonuclease VII large subunit [candidate division Zixibacteria bacterium]|nr:exodeoxyribonuclease VII large subunit [candidate division Zixibacteria bacterium]
MTAIPSKSEPRAYTVTAITRMIKTALEESFFDVWVEGEVTDYKHHTSGHHYFNLKDENASIRVTLWRSAAAYLKFEIRNGQHVRIHGEISVYEKQGNYQLNCRQIHPVGVGALELAFRQLHERLEKEGLFEASRKKQLPTYPTRIGIVTSPTGAAIRDIIQIARRRNDSISLIVYPAKVQGDGAESTIAAGLDYFNTREDIDLVIVGRGGGSIEDLWPFNTEITVRAIVRSRIPVISAVGHEVDITLSDLASDLRAPTPSAAAEIAIWLKEEFQESLRTTIADMANELNYLVQQARETLSSLAERPPFRRPFDRVNQLQQNLDDISKHLDNAGKIHFDKHKNRLSLLVSQLDALSPLKVLGRGYSVARRLPDGPVLTSHREIALGQKMETRLSKGKVISVVESTSE